MENSSEAADVNGEKHSQPTHHRGAVGQLRFIVAQKEENFENVCLESSKPTVENDEYGSQDSNSMHRETVDFTMRVKPGLLEKQQRQQRRQQQSCVNTSEDKVNYRREKDPSRGQILDNNS